MAKTLEKHLDGCQSGDTIRTELNEAVGNTEKEEKHGDDR